MAGRLRESLRAQAAHAISAGVAPGTTRQMERVQRLWGEYCGEVEVESEGSVNRETVMEFMCWYLRERSVNSFATVLSLLKRIFIERGQLPPAGWPDDWRWRIKRLQRGMETLRPTPVSKRPPVTEKLLAQLWKNVDWRDLGAVQRYAAIVVGFVGMLRVSELGGIRWADLRENGGSTGGFHIVIPVSKTSRGKAWQEHVQLVRPVDMPHVDSQMILARYQGLWKQRYGEMKGGDLMFGGPGRGRPWEPTVLNDWVEQGMRPLRGASAERYGVHSLRAGGLMFLLAQGYSEMAVAKQGRWASAARFEYYRDSPELTAQLWTGDARG